MAANKFATMLHRNTNKITLILIYAVLEWTLIILLLLNSLFSYLIIKFAEYFGLKPPCLWCSRVDHLFDHSKNNNIHRDLLCEAHATEVSKLSFCTNHHKLVEAQDMCQDCSSSSPGVSDKFGLFPWMKEIKMIENGKEMTLENDGEVALKCSCCGVCLESKFSTPYILIKPSWDDLEYTHKGNMIIEAADHDHDADDDRVEKGDDLDQNITDYAAEDQDEDGKNVVNQFLSDTSVSNSDVKEVEGEKEHLVLDGVTEYIEEKYKEKMLKDQGVQASEIEDAALEISAQHLEFFIDCSGHRLVPIELIDSTNEEDESKSQEKDENQEKDDDFQDEKEDVKLVLENRTIQVEEEVAGVCLRNNEREPKFAVLESMDTEDDENDLVFYAKELHSEREVYEQFEHVQESSKYHQVQILAAKERGEEDEDEEEEKEENLDVPPEELSKLLNNETDGEVSIGTEIPDLDLADEEPSTNSAHFHQVEVHGPNEDEDLTVELKTLSVALSGHVLNNQSSVCSDLNESEEDKFPDTPTSTDSFHQFHQKLLLVEKKDSGTEDSLDGSVASELESGDIVSTIEHLKSALKAERKALHSLYTELEEERSASAEAASQTMAMINRLQEEKAAMQMEALQYQRMMEEQSEYDQEALQLMNELMVKREKEKQEVEKELEVYRKRLLEYEAKERMRMLKRSKDNSTSGFSSASCSNAEDSDELSIDLNQEVKEDDSFYCHQDSLNHSTPVDAVINLEESLADFEEERMAILDQLKVLEEKLISLDDEDAKQFEDVRLMEDSFQDNGNHIEEDSHFNGEMNGHANGFSREMNGKHHPDRRIMNVKGKRLLPLFDAMSDENGNVTLNGHENGFHSNGVHDSYLKNFDLESKKLDVEEEFDHLHERLQALEADKEFLKNCVSSLKKGDKGMDLLQEILQHLRDLRNVELRARSMSDGPIV